MAVTKSQPMFGVGLRSKHYSHLEQDLNTQLDWFEALTENHMFSKGRPQTILQHISSRYPLSFHGVSLNIASHEPIQFDYLNQLKDLIGQFQPIIVSDHLCWTGLQHANLHNLLPFPYTQENLQYIAQRIDTIQNFLERPIAFENLSAYFSFQDQDFSEAEFLSRLTDMTGCRILLDINNIYVNSQNQNFDPKTFIQSINSSAVVEYHLAGYSDKGTFLFDTHSQPVFPDVWTLYEYALKHIGIRPTLVEWDDHIPEFKVLEAEALKAKAIWRNYVRKSQKSLLA